MLAILKALRVYSGSFLERLIVDSDLSNAIAWVSRKDNVLRKFYYFLNEIGSWFMFSSM